MTLEQVAHMMVLRTMQNDLISVHPQIKTAELSLEKIP